VILERLTIENLFCYHGRQEFDLAPPPGSERNIALVHGRNGHGKTSFLRSVRLLFGGVTDDLRVTAVPGRKLGPKQYVVGTDDPGLWAGVLNRRTRRDRRGSGRFGVEALLGRNGDAVSIRRWWDVDRQGTDFEEHVEVCLGQGSEPIEGENAREVVAGLLPPYCQEFFFFDGEVVQAMATEDDSARIAAMERLLDLEPLQILRDFVAEQGQAWSRDAKDAEARHELQLLDNTRKEILSKKEAVKQRRQDDRDELTRLRDQIGTAGEELDALHNPRLDEQVGALQDRRDRLRSEIEELRLNIATELPKEVPFLFNRPPLERAHCQLRELRPGGSEVVAAQVEILHRQLETLPGQLFDHPPHSDPPLTEGQRRHYSRRLERLLDSYMPEPSPEGPQIDPRTREPLLRQLERYVHADAERKGWVRKLRRLLEARQELQEVEERLEDASHLSEQQRHAWRRKKAEQDALVERLGMLESRLDQHEEEVGDLDERLSKTDAAIAQKQREVAWREGVRRKVEVAAQVRRFLAGFVAAARASRRQQLEAGIDRHFHELFSAHEQVGRIELDDGFRLRPVDRERAELGRGSLPAGMKQIIAISLLWALKDAAGHEIPVVIDTPLARLDREHQELMVERYFPQVARQVILLPTNSELTRGRYDQLRPRVYKEYRLENDESGERTRARAAPMYDGEQPAAGEQG